MAANFFEIQREARERWQRLTASDTPWIRVGTALCGQAAGAEEVAAAIESELQSQGVPGQVSRVGCLGPCFAEPLVDVLVPGQSRVVYGNVAPERAADIVRSHVEEGKTSGRPGPGLPG